MSNLVSENRLVRRYSVEMPVELNSPAIEPTVRYATRDISNRGIFLSTDRPLPQNSPIEFTIKLDAGGSGKEIRIVCAGTVVRVEAVSGRSTGMATLINSYRLLSGSQANA